MQETVNAGNQKESAELAKVTCSKSDKRTKMAFYHKVIRNRTECFTSEGIDDQKNSTGQAGLARCFKQVSRELL